MAERTEAIRDLPVLSFQSVLMLFQHTIILSKDISAIAIEGTKRGKSNAARSRGFPGSSLPRNREFPGSHDEPCRKPV